MKKLSIITIVTLLMVAVPTANAGTTIEDTGEVRFENCADDNSLLTDDIDPDYCIHIYPDNFDDQYEYFYTLPEPYRSETGYYDSTDYISDIDQFEDGDEIVFSIAITGEADEDGGYLISSSSDDDSFIEAYDDEDDDSIDDSDDDDDDSDDDSSDDSDDDSDDDSSDDSRTRRRIRIPSAGFEDRVITKFSAYINPFPDTNTDELEGRAAAELYRRSVLGGYPDGEFKGGRYVNRAEAAKFLLFARFGDTFSEHDDEDGGFKDVVRGQWYVRFIVEAASRSIIQGYPDGLFRPASTVNTAEFLKMLTLTFDLETDREYTYSDVDADAWYAKYAGTAEYYNLFPSRDSGELEPARLMTRNEVAVAIYQYLQNR